MKDRILFTEQSRDDTQILHFLGLVSFTMVETMLCHWWWVNLPGFESQSAFESCGATDSWPRPRLPGGRHLSSQVAVMTSRELTDYTAWVPVHCRCLINGSSQDDVLLFLAVGLKTHVNVKNIYMQRITFFYLNFY